MREGVEAEEPIEGDLGKQHEVGKVARRCAPSRIGDGILADIEGGDLRLLVKVRGSSAERRIASQRARRSVILSAMMRPLPARGGHAAEPGLQLDELAADRRFPRRAERQLSANKNRRGPFVPERGGAAGVGVMGLRPCWGADRECAAWAMAYLRGLGQGLVGVSSTGGARLLWQGTGYIGAASVCVKANYSTWLCCGCETKKTRPS
jgi:hypothetical protein